MLISLKRIIVNGWQHFTRNAGLSLATIFILSVTCLLFSCLYSFRGVTGSVIAELKEKVDISLYFKSETSDEDILKIYDEIKTLPSVVSVSYISKEEALELFKARYENDETVMESLAEVGNPLLASLNVRAKSESDYLELAKSFKDYENSGLIEKIDYNERQETISRIFALASSLNVGGLVISLFLAVFGVLISFNTVRLAIYDYRREIEVMRLVGASNIFVRGPFLVQGAVSGFFAFIVTLVVFTVSLLILSPKLAGFFSDFSTLGHFTANFWRFALLQFLTPIFLGLISSAIAVRRYLVV